MMKINFEFTKCNLCGSEDYYSFLYREDLNISLPGKFSLVKCRNCELVFLNPRPTPSEFDKLYPENYDQYLFSKKDEKLIQYSYYKRLKFIKTFSKAGDLLDIGCATGDFLDYVNHNSNFNVLGIEPNKKAAEFAVENYNLTIINKSLDLIDLKKNSFDIITMWNVIEHLNDPKNTLKIINEILKPTGFLIFNTPILNSLDYFLFRDYWIGFELPRHFYVFSDKTLHNLTNQTGFKILIKKSFYGSHASFMSSFRFWLTKNCKSTRFIIFLNRLVFSFFFRVMLSPFFFIIEKFNLASIPTFVCKKIVDNNDEYSKKI